MERHGTKSMMRALPCDFAPLEVGWLPGPDESRRGVHHTQANRNPMRNSTRAALTACSLVLTTAIARAQEVPTFHRGQWAAEFSGGAAVSAGVLRFYSPTSALAVSFGGTLSQSQSESNSSPDVKDSQGYLSLAIGLRRHTSVAPRVLARTEFGFVGNASKYRNQYTDVTGAVVESRQSIFGAGGYGEIGGQYFVTPHIALGAAGTLMATRNWGSSRTGTSRSNSRGFLIATGLTPIQLTLYF
jgi:hypothetical protein